jgi:acyl-CoA reductase-like NAD-dependent aldehyde dehydrogenase
VKIHGPGDSKVFVSADQVEKDSVIDRLEAAMMSDGGRGCINMSQIVTTGDADHLAERLAERVAETTLYSPLDESAVVPAVPDPEQADRLNRLFKQSVSDDGIEDISERYDDQGRVVERNGVTYLRPTVVRLDWSDFEDGSHRLFRELPFQYASVVSVPEDEIVSALSDSLAVTLLSDDQELEKNLLKDPSVEKLYANGDLTCDIDLREPHEGFLSEFLFSTQAYRKSR